MDILDHHQMAVCVYILDILAILRTLLAKVSLALLHEKHSFVVFLRNISHSKELAQRLLDNSYLILN